MLSEESAASPARLGAERVWIVDPLDGTRGFRMEGRADWAVHVALWESGKGITAAAVAEPALDWVYANDDAVAADLVERMVLLVSDSRPPEFAGTVAEAIGRGGSNGLSRSQGNGRCARRSRGLYACERPVGVGLCRSRRRGDRRRTTCLRIDGSPLIYNQANPYLPGLLICGADLAGPVLTAIKRET